MPRKKIVPTPRPPATTIYSASKGRGWLEQGARPGFHSDAFKDKDVSRG